MANYPDTVAGHLDRIEDASIALAQKAANLGLKTTEGATIIPDGENQSTIDEVANAFNNITVNDGDDATFDANATPPAVNVDPGFYKEGVSVDIPTAERATTTIEANEGDEGDSFVIVAKNEQGTGYVKVDDTKKNSARTEGYINFTGKTASVVVSGKQVAQANVDDGDYSAGVSKVSGSGQVAAEGFNDTGFDLLDKAPTNGEHYIKVTGSGHVEVKGTAKITKDGYLAKDTTGKSTGNASYETGNAEKFLVFSDVEFKNGKGEAMEIVQIDPTKETSITFDEGYTKGGMVSVSGELLERLRKI